MARTFTYLFGIGATLLLVTLPLPHSADRDTAGLVVMAIAAYLAALGFLVLFDRLPLWFYEATPLLGTILVSLAVYFGGSDAAAAYAAYYFWVALAACYFLRPAVAATHLALASAGYGIALLASAEVEVPALNVGAGDRVAVRRRHPDDGAAGPDGEDAGRAGRGGPHRLPDRAREPPRARGSVRRRARALDPGRAAAGDRGARPGLVQGVQRSVRARRRRRRPGPARRGAEAGDADQRRRRAAGRRGVRRARAGDGRGRGLSARRAAPRRGQSDLRPPAGEDDGELRRGRLPRARHHHRGAPPLGRSSAVRGQGGADGTDRSSSSHAGAPAEDAEEAAIERTSPRLASLVSLAEAVDRRKGSPANSRRVARYAERLARRLNLPEEEVERVRIAALLRDVGEVGVAESILNKPVAAQRRGTAGAGAAPGDRRPHRRGRPARPGGRVDPEPSRAPRRQRLSARPARAPDPARGKDPGGRRRLCGDDRGPALPAAASRRSGPGPSSRRGPGASSTTTWSRPSCRWTEGPSPSAETRRGARAADAEASDAERLDGASSCSSSLPARSTK